MSGAAAAVGGARATSQSAAASDAANTSALNAPSEQGGSVSATLSRGKRRAKRLHVSDILNGVPKAEMIGREFGKRDVQTGCEARLLNGLINALSQWARESAPDIPLAQFVVEAQTLGGKRELKRELADRRIAAFRGVVGKTDEKVAGDGDGNGDGAGNGNGQDEHGDVDQIIRGGSIRNVGVNENANVSNALAANALAHEASASRTQNYEQRASRGAGEVDGGEGDGMESSLGGNGIRRTFSLQKHQQQPRVDSAVPTEMARTGLHGTSQNRVAEKMDMDIDPDDAMEIPTGDTQNKGQQGDDHDGDDDDDEYDMEVLREFEQAAKQ